MSLRKLLTLRAVAALVLSAMLATLPLAASAQAASAPAVEAPAAAAAPAPTAAPTPLTATTSKETVDNPYGLSALWQQGDFVSRGTLLILVIMSMGSWYILVT
ncbi:MAG TPA: MotA/TolQ/ExbB proton channel family protein, partial [Albitalea sp.]